MRFLSHSWSIARGSVGGITYSSNQFHQLIARARTSPVNPKTTYQTQILSAFCGAVELWKQATETVRQGWRDYASTLVFEGPLGQYSVPGRQVFIGNISTAIYLKSRTGLPPLFLDIAPIIPGFLDISSVRTSDPIGPAVTGVSFVFTNDSPRDVITFGKRSVGWNQTRNHFNGPFLSSTLDSVYVAVPQTGRIDFIGLKTGLVYFMNPRIITAYPPFRLSALFNLRMIAVDVV